MKLIYFCLFFACFGLCTTLAALTHIEPRDVPEDATLSVPQLIRKYGYPEETHHIKTEDDYVLEVHRIPHDAAGKTAGNTNKPVVLIQHGLLSSSADWVIPGPNKSIAYLLADMGFDVWLGNARGNKYSRNHTTLTTENRQFWKFSWHEIGVYDLPAIIDYQLKVTNTEQIFYIGHSQGTTAFYVMCTEKPEYNEKIQVHFSLAPVAFMKHIESPLLRILAKYEQQLDILAKLIGWKEFRPNMGVLGKFLGDKVCGDGRPTQFICTNVLYMLFGFNPQQMDKGKLPTILGHTPAGASVMQPLHYAQEINSGKFRQFDYGLIKNLIKYKSIHPPNYDLSKITAPVVLFYSHNDWLSAEIDVLKLYNKLPNTVGRFLISDAKFNHADYLYAKDAVTILYNKIFSLMYRFL